jgi:hemoglobin
MSSQTRASTSAAGANIAKVKTSLVDRSAGIRGPCTAANEGRCGMKITDAEFDALVEDLVKSLDKLKVAEREKGELLAALGGMRKDIVGQ